MSDLIRFLPQEEKYLEKIWDEFQDCGLESKNLLSIIVDRLFAMMTNPDFASMFLSLKIRKDARDSLGNFIDATNLVGQKALKELRQDIIDDRYDTPELVSLSKSFGQTAKFLQDIVDKADNDANALAMIHHSERIKLSEEFEALPDRGKSWVFYGISVLVRIAKELNLEVKEDTVKELEAIDNPFNVE